MFICFFVCVYVCVECNDNQNVFPTTCLIRRETKSDFMPKEGRYVVRYR